jgi:hypothetical protein
MASAASSEGKYTYQTQKDQVEIAPDTHRGNTL